jgi:hypothetical protein
MYIFYNTTINYLTVLIFYTKKIAEKNSFCEVVRNKSYPLIIIIKNLTAADVADFLLLGLSLA